jgi:hypothetical protein
MTFAVYGQFTARGIARIAAQREARRLAQLSAPEPKPAPVTAPERNKVIQFPRRPARLISDKVKNALHLGYLDTIRPHQPPTGREIISMVAGFHGLTYADLIGPSRFRNVVEARFDAIVAIHLVGRIQGRFYTSTEIGKLLGRDHSTVLHALRARGYR